MIALGKRAEGRGAMECKLEREGMRVFKKKERESRRGREKRKGEEYMKKRERRENSNSDHNDWRRLVRMR